MNTYEKVKYFIQYTSDKTLLRNIAIELLDNGNDYEDIYMNYKSEIDNLFN